MMWRVGDGTQIRVFHDKWIPGCFPNGVVPHIPGFEDDFTVSSLINQTKMEWDGELIDFKIAPFMAQQIKAIPLCRTVMRDCLVWPRTRDGNYSVKTGYQLLGELENKGEALGSNSNNLRSFWKGIWNMRIPNKIKNFCWRACTESLPTLVNLHRRNVVNSPVCNSCDLNRETVLHALWECDQIQICWGRGFNKVRQAQMQLGSFSDLVFAVKQYEEDIELFTVIAWFFWCRRNKCHFKEQCLPPEKIVDAT